MDYAQKLPRLSELRATMTEPEHADSFSRNFESSLKANPAELRFFQKLEADLALLDNVAWTDLKTRAARYLVSRTREKDRGWQDA